MGYDFNIDIHCHSSWKPYMSGRNNPAHTPFETYNNEVKAWWLKGLSRQIENAVHIKFGTQSNFDNLHKGNVRVVVVSLSPIEKEFFAANLKTETFFYSTLKTLVTKKHTPGTYSLKTDVVNVLTGFDTGDLEFSKIKMQNYFAEGLVPEYNYLTQFNNRQSTGENYIIKFVKNGAEIEEAIKADTPTICVIISVEGAHTLSSRAPHMYPVNNNYLQEPPGISTLIAEYTQNIEEMKKWEFAPLFITLNHHFRNGLGGHAKSLGKPLGALVSQAQGINEGLKELGKEVIRLLLNTGNGPRILVDIKHMSPQCRKDFYSFIQTEYWSNNDKFPLICSHTGVVSKNRTLDGLTGQDDDWETLDNSNFLHENSINICEEDILMIAESGGLIGLQLDERRIAGNRIITVIKKNRKYGPGDLRRQYVKVVFANIFEIVKTVDSKRGWNILSIGSDFDGFIHPLEFYPTTAELPDLRNDMLAFLICPEEISQNGFNYSLPLTEIKRLMFDLTAEEIIEKIFAKNVMAFLQNNFNR